MQVNPIASTDVLVDETNNTLVTITHSHNDIHEGSSFVVSDVQSVSTTTFKWQITTPAGTMNAHLILDIDCTGEMLFTFTEGSDRTDGTALAEINRRRVGTPATSTVIVTHTPTAGATDGAVTLWSKRVGASGVSSKTLTGGGARGVNEFVLKPSTKYVIAVQTFAAVFVSFDVDWYEHTDL